jgi:hypothetical protein
MVCPSAFRSPAGQTREGFEKETILTGHSYYNWRRNEYEVVCLDRGMRVMEGGSVSIDQGIDNRIRVGRKL